MLNRRFLRIKAMQAVYAYRQRTISNFNMALAEIEEQFEPNVLAEIQPDPILLEENKKEALALFKASIEKGVVPEKKSEEIMEVVLNAIQSHKESDKKEFERIKTQMLDDTQGIVKHFFNVLKFLDDLAALIEKLREKSKSSRVKPSIESSYKLADNLLIKSLRGNDLYQNQIAKFGEDWLADGSILRKVYKDVIQKDERYEAYIKNNDQDMESDRAMLVQLVRKVLFKSELFLSHFEESDVHWEENQEIVLILVLKSLKNVDQEGGVKLFSLSENWAEDKAYFLKLFESSARRDDDIHEKITARLRNWDEERVALIDFIIMQVALMEMIHFPSIPIKVSINEFIELSKQYSTPKSKIFINGILDGVSKELIDSGRIRKSGRGLIDNK